MSCHLCTRPLYHGETYSLLAWTYRRHGLIHSLCDAICIPFWCSPLVPTLKKIDPIHVLIPISLKRPLAEIYGNPQISSNRTGSISNCCTCSIMLRPKFRSTVPESTVPYTHVTFTYSLLDNFIVTEISCKKCECMPVIWNPGVILIYRLNEICDRRTQLSHKIRSGRGRSIP